MADAGREVGARDADREEQALRRPGRFWINVALTVAVLALMISGVLSARGDVHDRHGGGAADQLSVCRMQRDRVDAHAQGALMMAEHPARGGRFTGIMKGPA